MDLLITSAGDVTSDLLCEWAGQRVLRLNLERHREYHLRMDHSSFEVADQHGRLLSSENLGNIIWRKPVDDVEPTLEEEWYAFHEFRYAVRALVSSRVREAPRTVPINPFQLSQIDKLSQLRAAAAFFAVPEWTFTTQPSRLLLRDAITKSWSGRPILGTGIPPKILFATSVDVSTLADGWPWFVQRKIDAAFDITIVHVDGRNFGFALNRSLFEGLDWRPHIGSDKTDGAWQEVSLSSGLNERINAFMRTLGLRFGRLDFLSNDKDAENPWFLEVNPNGQWAWLDLTLKNGLFDAMTAFLFS